MPDALASPNPASRALDRALAWVGRRLATNLGYTAVYAVLFAVGWMPALCVLAACGKSFFWSFDGLSQQYVWFVYTGQWLRDAASALLAGRPGDIELWSMDMGFGADTIPTVAFQAINPFYAVSALVSEAWAEYAFEASMLLQVFCAGLAFTAWCLPHGVARPHALVGALVYVFAGNMVAVFHQPGFLFAPLVFPLVLRGVDRVFEGRGPGPYVGLLAWSLAYSFYDSYMMLLLAVPYCLLVFFGRVDASGPRAGKACRLARWVLVFVGYTLLAIAIAGVLFVPQAMSLAGAGRLELERSGEVLYEPAYYVNFLMGLTTYTYAGGDAYTGLGVLVVPLLAVLALNARRRLPVLVAFLALTAMALLPLCGRIMNAMAYPTNRWCWAYALCGAYLVARLVPDLLGLGRRGARVVLAVMAVYAAACLALPVSGRAKVVCCVMLVCVVPALLWRRSASGRSTALLAACAAACGAVSFAWHVAPGLGGQAANLVDAGGLWDAHAQGNPAALVARARAEGSYDEVYRVDRPSSESGVHNSGLVAGYMAPDFYNSIYNDGVDRLWGSLGLTDTWGVNIGYGALGSRAALDALLGVRYFCVPADDEDMLPFTFSDAAVAARGTDGAGRDLVLYETDHVVPLASVWETYVTEEEYASVALVDRQAVLLGALVVDDAAATEGLVHADADDFSSSRDLPWEVMSADGCEVLDGRVVAQREGATVELAFDAPAESEVYAVFEGLRYIDPLHNPEEAGLPQPAGFSAQVRDLARRALTWEVLSGGIHLFADGCGYASCVTVLAEDNHMYGGKHDWVCSLGYDGRGGPMTVRLSFDAAGVYAFDSFSVAACSSAGTVERIDEVRDAVATGVELGANRIACTVDADGDALVFFSVAYSEGWSAEVDGEPAEVVRADLGFMAVPVGPGEHEVVLTYRTPWLAEGAALSAAGLAAAAVVRAVRRRRAAREAGFSDISTIFE